MDLQFRYAITEVNKHIDYPRNIRFRTMHSHSTFQLVYCTDGIVKIAMLAGEHEIKAGEAIFLNSNVVHQDIVSTEGAYYSFNFSKELVSFGKNLPTEVLLNEFAENPGCPCYIFDEKYPWMRKILFDCEKLIELEKNKTDTYYYEVLHLLTGIMLQMLKNLSIPQNMVRNHDEERMQKVLTLIEEHYSENITLARMALAANISKSELLRLFHRTLECTPYQYLMAFRLRKASELLQKTALSIGEISGEVGITNQSQFGSHFKKFTGYTPSEYRKRFK